MTAHAAVGIHNDLASGQPRIAGGTANDKSAGGIDVIHNIIRKEAGGNNLFDHILHQRFQCLFLHIRGVLVGDNNGGHADGLAVLVLHGNLTLGVRAEEGIFFRLFVTQPRQFRHDFVRIKDRGRHQFFRFIAGVTEHHTLVTGALCVIFRFRHTLGNIGGLSVDADKDLAVVGRKSDLRIVVPDVPDHTARDFCPGDNGFRCDLAGNHDQVGGAKGLTRNAAFRVLRKTGIQNCVRDLVCDFIGMSFRNGFGSEYVICPDLTHS